MKLSNISAVGEPEDQLGPDRGVAKYVAELCGFPRRVVTAIGETAIGDLKTRPDYAVTVRNAQVGFIEIKAPGKGADPRRFRNEHDKAQWQKLQCLPNVVYTDGNEFSLWRDGQIVGAVVRLEGDVALSGNG